MVQPTPTSISILCDRTEAAKNFVSGLNEKYSHYMKDRAINTNMKKLEYAINTESKRIDEIKDGMIDDDMEAKVPGPSKRRDFQDILP